MGGELKFLQKRIYVIRLTMCRVEYLQMCRYCALSLSFTTICLGIPVFSQVFSLDARNGARKDVLLQENVLLQALASSGPEAAHGQWVLSTSVLCVNPAAMPFSPQLPEEELKMLLLFSIPVGLHRQLMEPGISPFWKFLQVVLTFMMVIPSILTAFFLFATFELYGKSKGPKTGSVG